MSAFVTAFKKPISPQKTTNYPEVEAQVLARKGMENLLRFPLKVPPESEKGWRDEPAATINLKCTETFIRGLSKKLKDFALKRQIKQTTAETEPSIPFHTHVKHVDADYITD